MLVLQSVAGSKQHSAPRLIFVCMCTLFTSVGVYRDGVYDRGLKVLKLPVTTALISLANLRGWRCGSWM